MATKIEQLDGDTNLLSFDQFLIFFVRLQPKLNEWNSVIEKEHSNLKGRSMPNYIFNDKIQSLPVGKLRNDYLEEIGQRWN